MYSSRYSATARDCRTECVLIITSNDRPAGGVIVAACSSLDRAGQGNPIPSDVT